VFDLTFLPSAATELSDLLLALYQSTSIGVIIVPIIVIGLFKLGLGVVMRSA
jgi:hypothetical protein